MPRRKPIFYSALMLTGVNLLLRMVGTGFHVYLSRRIGASGIGLLQLVMSVGSLAMVAGVAGVRTAAMYLTAEELGKHRSGNISAILSACFRYSILCSGTVSLLLYAGAPTISRLWIGNPQTVPALKMLAAFLPVSCLCGVMSGYFTAANRIGTLAAVEVAEQCCSMTVTLLALHFWAEQDAGRACIAVILGGSMGSCVTLLMLLYLRAREKAASSLPFPCRSRLIRAAVPLALADIVRSGIGTTENLLVPKRLALYQGEVDPLSAFGRISGMVFPLMMFPACILYALAELLIPEMARCNAAGSHKRIQYLVERSLWTAMLYGIFFAGLIHLTAIPLCTLLYKSPEAGTYLRSYAFLIPFLYCDAITDAITKGLGQQKICVRYNILTSLLDVAGLYLMLPVWGMRGYYISFLISHLLNFALSLRRLCIITSFRIPFHIPALAASAGLLAVWIAGQAHTVWLQISFIPLLAALLSLFGILRKQDIRWFSGLLKHA